MKKYNEWEDLVGSNGRYKIRLMEDGKTVQIRGCKYGRSAIISRRKTKDGYDIYGIYYKYKESKTMRAHQLSYKQWVDNDYWPRGNKFVLDHIDGDHENNHPNNLRQVSHRENCSKEKTIKSGLPVGVCLRKDTGKYQARIWFGRACIGLGCHLTPELAFLAYQEALLKGKDYYV